MFGNYQYPSSTSSMAGDTDGEFRVLVLLVGIRKAVVIPWPCTSTVLQQINS